MLRDVENAREQGALADGGLEHLVLEREERVRRPLNGARMMVRVGPSLGLLGTLIPMGSSLASMAAGNLEAMAGQMVVAFTSTDHRARDRHAGLRGRRRASELGDRNDS